MSPPHPNTYKVLQSWLVPQAPVLSCQTSHSAIQQVVLTSAAVLLPPPPPSLCHHPRQYADLLEGLAAKQRALEAYAGGGRAAELGRVKQRLEDLSTRLAATQQVGQGTRWQGTACVSCVLSTW
jgi:hypothetical protein